MVISDRGHKIENCKKKEQNRSCAEKVDIEQQVTINFSLKRRKFSINYSSWNTALRART